MNIGAGRRQRRGLFEERDGCVVVASAQGVERCCERFICGIFLFLIFLFLSQRGGGNQT